MNSTGTIIASPMEPLTNKADLGKGIIVPMERFEQVLEQLDWTWQQIARGEFPPAFYALGKDKHERLTQLQLAIICEDPLLWCTAFLREPEDLEHKQPYQFFDYQVPSLMCQSSVVHQDGAEVGKTREIVAWTLWQNFTQPGGSGLVAAPQQTHLDEIIDAKLEQLNYNPLLTADLKKHRKQPHHMFIFTNGFKEYFRPAGHDGEAFRGVHVRNYGMIDEAAKMKHKKQWSEFWRALKPGAVARAYSVPDGDRETEYYKLTMRAASQMKEGDTTDDDTFKGEPGHVKNLEWTLFRWGKHLMPAPYWSPERKRFLIDQFGGEDSPEYRHNVLGEHGDPENTVFPWNQLKHCIRDIPEYRGLKILVDTNAQEVIVEGYRCDYTIGPEGPVGNQQILLEQQYNLDQFFELEDDGSSVFRDVVNSFFIQVPGLVRGGGDFGFSPDPTELTIWNEIGTRDRLVARLQLKQVTYDQQCQGLDALDTLYSPTTSMLWGTDYGNAGSAVAHDLQGLAIYDDKDYDDRLRGFMFQAKNDNIDEQGEPIFDAQTGKPSKITFKELATDLIVKKVQRQMVELPPDPDLITAYTNHTCRIGERQRIYNKQNDHLLDSHRVSKLAGVMMTDVEDIFV